MDTTHIALIDSSSRHRAYMARGLHGVGRHVEPFESVAEFSVASGDRRILLVHDEGTAIKDVISFANNEHKIIGVVGYSAKPRISQAVYALQVGALHYFDIDGEGDFKSLHSILEYCEATLRVESRKMELRFSSEKRLDRLTPREKEVLRCMARGLSTKAMSASLLISTRTVEVHRAHVIGKLYASNSADAVRIALEAGLHL